MKNYLVYACPEMKFFAHLLEENYPAEFKFMKIDWNYFPDGTPNIFIHNIEQVNNRNVLFLASFSKPIHKFDQFAVMMVLCESFIKSLTVILPFSPTATMERVDKEGQIATANVDAWLFNSLPRPGPAIKLIIYDLHTLQNRFYIKGNCLLKMVTAVPLFLDKLVVQHRNEKIAIAFPDDGAFKRFGKLFVEQGYPTIICGKVRVEDQRIVKIKEGPPSLEGFHVFIVDDLVQTGGTLIECKNALIEAGAEKVSCFVTHVVFPNDSFTKFTDAGFEKFYCTNSIPFVAEKLTSAPFEVLSLFPLLIQDLK